MTMIDDILKQASPHVPREERRAEPDTPGQVRDVIMQFFPGKSVRVRQEAVHFCDCLEGCDQEYWSAAVMDRDGNELSSAHATDVRMLLAKLRHLTPCQPITAAEQAGLEVGNV